MNCRACHLVDESSDRAARGVRTYGDFARRSPIPERGDGRTHTPRNSPPLVNATLARDGSFFLHFDGEFASAEELVEGGFTGRNFGWLPDERRQARRPRCPGGPRGRRPASFPVGPLRVAAYATLLAGTSPEIPAACRVPEGSEST